MILLIWLLLVSLSAVACGSYKELEYREPLDTIELDMSSGRAMEPSEITLDRPGTYAVAVKNVTNDEAHALEIRSTEDAQLNYKEGSVRTADIPPGEGAPEFKVNLGPGTYEISDPIGHREAQGAKGTITVKEG